MERDLEAYRAVPNPNLNTTTISHRDSISFSSALNFSAPTGLAIAAAAVTSSSSHSLSSLSNPNPPSISAVMAAGRKKMSRVGRAVLSARAMSDQQNNINNITSSANTSALKPTSHKYESSGHNSNLNKENDTISSNEDDSENNNVTDGSGGNSFFIPV